MAEAGLLLDTHVWIWAVEGVALSSRITRLIEQTRTREQVYVSAVSVREVVLLAERGRLTLTMPADAWVRQALRASGVFSLVLDPEVAALSARLPGTPPRDPADQMLLASAMVYGLRLVTRDRAMIAYAESRGVKVREA